MGPAGAGSLAQVINAALANKERFDVMKEFFTNVGTGNAAGIWEDTPKVPVKKKAAKAESKTTVPGAVC